MQEIKIHVTHEWRSGHADPLARIERIIEAMNDITTRLTASVDNLATALSNQTGALDGVAVAIRNHPASTTDNGALASLADRIDSIAASLNSSTAELQQLKGEEAAEDTGPQQPVDPTPAPAAGDVGSGSDTVPPAGAGDGSATGAGDAGSSSGDAGVPSGTSADGSGSSDVTPE